MGFPLRSLLCTVFLLNAAVFVNLALCLAVCGSASVESFALLPFSCFRHVWHRFIDCLPLELFTLSFSLKLASSRSATYNLAAALLSARGRAPTKTGLCCESSSGSSVLLMARVLQLHNGVLCNLDLFLKLRHVEEFPGCRHVIGDVSRVELEMQIRLVFSLKSHAPRVTERQCLIPKAVS